ncbi:MULTISPECIES: cytochrome P450 [unclassified Bacillus (in: firmicutes)]|uniref:cytochrome P450 n=1 Tax=unclassified Bacillus (in: firmicutes) TaxID=185979 RepID=UPI0022809B33|nr:cytochrome P450 [Bacillus sp. S20C3]MCY8287066.1 cytochrome P450 [Bacillus sp. N13C7]MCY8639406.1 cytochrome P450 [Bacillus sp. S17B2]MCY9143795.1 cytochrome P450 [Bacillus sp. T9C1]
MTIASSTASSGFLKNPYPFYETLRAVHPIYKGSFMKYPGWYVTGYEETAAILKDTRFKVRPPLPERTTKYQDLTRVQKQMMLFQNQPDHRRLRTMASGAFTPRMTECYRSYIEETVHRLLDQVQGKKKMEVISDFAFPLASFVIANIIGVPEEDREQLKEWAASLIQTIDFTRSRKALTEGNHTAVQAMAFFRELIQKRKQQPQQDMISMLLRGKEKDKLTEEEAASTCILLAIAGHETTVNLISNSILCLLQHPQQLLKLKENPDLIDTAVEECLRYESPTRMTARVASEDIDISGVTIRQGEQVYLLLGAANRDPNIFAHPDVFDMTRSPNPHLSFGHGHHICMGSSLARLEAQIAVNTLLQRMPGLQLADCEWRYRPLFGFRALEELPVTFE